MHFTLYITFFLVSSVHLLVTHRAAVPRSHIWYSDTRPLVGSETQVLAHIPNKFFENVSGLSSIGICACTLCMYMNILLI